jgi:serine protease Do
LKTATKVILLLAGAGMGLATDFTQAAAAARPSLVSIITDKADVRPAATAGESAAVQGQALGSGFVLDTLGHILTCNHVVADHEAIAVRFDDDSMYQGADVTVVGQDPLTDLAVIRVKARRKLVPAKLADSDKLEVGQPVMAMGSPFGLEGTATSGIVSGLSRWGLHKSSGPDFQDFIQTDALVNPGNSGGPLLDVEGRVVGVSSFTRTVRSGPTGIGFATPINLARSVAEQLVKHGRVTRGYLGISTQPITTGIRQALGLPSSRGALVSSVEYGRPGMAAGLSPGDAILSLDGKAVPDVRWFQSEVAAREPGSTVTLGMVRKGQKKTVTATLAAGVTPVREPGKAPLVQAWLGLVVRDLTEADKQAHGVTAGVVTATVEPGSPAFRANIRQYDAIVEVNLAPLHDAGDFARIEKVMSGTTRPLLFRVFRGHQAFYTAVQP